MLFSLPYFVVIPQLGLLVRILMDPLQLRRHGRDTFWLPMPTEEQNLADARRRLF